jgi:hypothetical protein
MFCPNCRYEYIRGVATCPDCGVALVDELPSEPAKQPKDSESVIVYISISQLKSALVKSILEDAGIEYVTTHDWQGGYRLTFRVRSEEAAKAGELLLDINKEEPLNWKDTGEDL